MRTDRSRPRLRTRLAEGAETETGSRRKIGRRSSATSVADTNLLVDELVAFRAADCQLPQMSSGTQQGFFLGEILTADEHVRTVLARDKGKPGRGKDNGGRDWKRQRQ